MSAPRYLEGSPHMHSKGELGCPDLSPAGSIQHVQKKEGLMQPNLSPAGSIQAEWANEKPTQQVIVQEPTPDAVPLEEACTSLQMQHPVSDMRQIATRHIQGQRMTGASTTTAATTTAATGVGSVQNGATTTEEQPTDGKAVQDDAAVDPCEYLEGHGAAPFKNQAEIDAEITEKRQALLTMKVALGNEVAEPAETQTVVPHDFGYTPSKGDHRNVEQRAADAKHVKEVRKAEAALKAKQHEYEKEQEKLAQEQAAADGQAIAKRLQQAHLAATPSTAGHAKHQEA